MLGNPLLFILFFTHNVLDRSWLRIGSTQPKTARGSCLRRLHPCDPMLNRTHQRSLISCIFLPVGKLATINGRCLSGGARSLNCLRCGDSLNGTVHNASTVIVLMLRSWSVFIHPFNIFPLRMETGEVPSSSAGRKYTLGGKSTKVLVGCVG